MTPRLRREDRMLLSELGEQYRLWSPRGEPTLISCGTENTTFAVGDYIVRRTADLDATTREAELLLALSHAASAPIPIPELQEPARGILAYRRLRGRPLLHSRQRDSQELRQALIDVLTALREIPCAPNLPVDRYPNEAWLTDARKTYRTIQDRLGADQARTILGFLNQPPPPTRSDVTAQHNDLGAEHILVDDQGMVTGIIDWTDAALADPARDIGSLYRDLGPEAALCIAEAVNGTVSDDELDRIRFHARCRWLEDVAFGLRCPAERQAYLDNAARTFDHTFADQT